MIQDMYCQEWIFHVTLKLIYVIILLQIPAELSFCLICFSQYIRILR